VKRTARIALHVVCSSPMMVAHGTHSFVSTVWLTNGFGGPIGPPRLRREYA